MDYQEVTPELIEQFQKIAPGRVKVKDGINADIGHDEMPIYGRKLPDIVIDAASTEEMRLMREIKKVFDPNMILNPGKVCYKL